MINFLALFVILTLAFFLGAKDILHGDFMFLYDQVREMILVRDMVLTHKVMLIGTHSGIGGVFHGPLWIYFLTPFFLLGGGNPFFFTIPYILLSLTIVLVGYIVGYKLYNKTFGLFIAFFLAINVRIWGYVSSIQSVNVTPLIYLLIFYFLILFSRGKRWLFVLVSFFVGVTYQFETASAMILTCMLPILYSLLSIDVFSYKGKGNFVERNKEKVKREVKILFASLFAFLISLSTFIFFDLRHQFLMTKSLVLFLGHTEKGKGYLSFAERVPSHIDSLKEVFISFIFSRNATLEVLFVILSVLAIFFLIKDRQVHGKDILKEYLLCLFFPLLMFLLLLFYAYPVYPEYVLGLLVPVVLWIGLSIQILSKKQYGKVLIFLFVSLTTFLILKDIYQSYHATYQDSTKSGSYRAQKAVVDWIFKDSLGKPFGYFVYSPDTFTYNMDYLFWWEGIKYHYQPQSQKMRITYLILYPPLQNDRGAHDFWKKNVLKTSAQSISTRIFLGEIIVQKIYPQLNESSVDPNYYQNLIFR